MSYHLHKSIAREIVACRFRILHSKLLIRPENTRNFVISADVFESRFTQCNFDEKAFEKFFHARNSTKIIKWRKQLPSTPQKLIFEKNDLLLD